MASIDKVCTCTGITSQTGVDQAEGPDKVWRCDTCGLIWEGVESVDYTTDPIELMRQHPSESPHPWDRAGFIPDDPCRDRIKQQTERIIDAIEDIFLAHLPSKALSYCAQEDVNAGLDAMRERFGVDDREDRP